MTPSDPTPDEAPQDRLPRHTTPTWEVELLISGIAVFAMLQLPGWLNERRLFLLPRFAEDWRAMLFLVLTYVASAAVILAVTFALHLLLRAYWIALVGVHSVHPDGIRWEHLRMGPIEREVMQRRDGDFAKMIERADNRASIVFAVGVALAMTLLAVTALVVGVLAAGAAIAAALRWQFSPVGVLFAFLAIVMVPTFLMYVLDRTLGDRLRTGNPLRRMVAAGYRLRATLGLTHKGGVLGALASHHGSRRVEAIAGVAVALCILGVTFGQLALRTPGRLGNYALFPHFIHASAARVNSAHYGDQRDPLRDGSAPFVQSAVITGSYLRLVVPYQPDRDAAAMRQTCAAAPEVNDDDARAAALLRCLAALHPATLDGKTLAGLAYEVGIDPDTDRPALVAMIDVRALAPGKHVLRVARPASTEADDDRDASTGWIIPFWR